MTTEINLWFRDENEAEGNLVGRVGLKEIGELQKVIHQYRGPFESASYQFIDKGFEVVLHAEF